MSCFLGIQKVTKNNVEEKLKQNLFNFNTTIFLSEIKNKFKEKIKR